MLLRDLVVEEQYAEVLHNTILLVIPVIGTFFVFSDYMKPAARMASTPCSGQNRLSNSLPPVP